MKTLHSQQLPKTFRKKITFDRWLDIIILATIACLIYFLLSLFLEPYASVFITKIGIYPISFLWLIYSLILSILLLPVVRYGGFSVKSFLKYPPFWLAALIDLIIIWLFQQHNSNFSNWYVNRHAIKDLLWTFSIGLTGFFLSVGYYKLIKYIKKKGQRVSEQFTEEIFTDDINSLLQWIEEEKPIETPFQDRLNTKVIADRIAEVLSKSPLITISVVGGYGTGKSSILKMVQNYLRSNEAEKKQNNSVILVDVCGWGLQKGTAAETILKQVVQGCSEHVDCFGLSNLPAQYAASIGALSVWSKTLSNLLSISYNPMATLERMDSILLAINKKVIIFIEDLDRNWQDDEFWVEIISLLDRLKKLTRVSFVLAITDTTKIGDVINRISDHVEIIPKLSVGHFAEIYGSFRDQCLQAFDDIQLEGEESRYRRIITGNIKERNEVYRQMGVQTSDEADIIATLIENPRNLKHALRRTSKAWQSLHGEIEFDDLFIANSIRVSELGVFNFIHENISDIRWLDRQGIKQEDQQKERTALKEKLANVTKSPSRNEAIEILLTFLFPYWKYLLTYKYSAIQGFSKIDPTDYWERMLREKLDDEEMSDQEVARSIISWKENNDDLPVYKNLRLAQAITEIIGLPDKLKQFGELMLNTEQIHKLVSQLFQIVFREKGLKDEYYPGRNQLKKLMESIEFKRDILFKENIPRPFYHFTWLVEEVNNFLPYSLLIAARIYHYWLLYDFAPQLTEDRDIAYKAVLEKAKACYSDNHIFINAIKDDDYSINAFYYALINPYRRIGKETNPVDWQWLADLLIKNIERHYLIIISQILGLFVFQEAVASKSHWILNTQGLQKFFQGKTEDIMILLSKLDNNQYTGEKKLIATVAREQAAKWLNDQKEFTKE